MLLSRVSRIIPWWFLLFLLPSNALATKPMVPMFVQLEMQGTPQVGAEIPVVLKIRSMMNARKVKVHFTLPKGLEMVSGDAAWEGTIEAGTVKEIPFVVRAKKAGRYVIKATATMKSGRNLKMSHGAVLLIELEEDQPGSQGQQKKSLKGKHGVHRSEIPSD